MFLKSSIFHWISFWPPFLVSGVKVKKYSPDQKSLSVEMGLRFWNWNHERAHFGGSLYAMTDPFYALLIREHIGTPVEVWVKSAQIRFKRPGRGKVLAQFLLTEEKLNEIKNELSERQRAQTEFTIDIKDAEGHLIAEAQQMVTIKLKP